ncbi:Bet v1-like protein [Martensiomyces pterosporus]|nr:Bet v1-like protein [Martensiomyces pterosporus]
MKLASQDDTAPGSPWTPLVSQTAPYPVTVQGHKTKPFCFRITFYAPTLPGTAFDLLANILRRPEWDELTETTRIVDQLSQADSIHYLKMKPVWPTAARDSVLISHIASVKLGGSEKAEEAGDGAEYGYLNASQSIEDDRVPERKEEGIVRMEAGIAGQLVTLATKEDKERLGLVGENWCKVVQLADGDLKGWIPKSVIKFIATQALPRSLTKVSKQLAGMQHGMESQLIRNLTIPAAKAYSATAAPPSSSSVPTAASSASAPAARRTVHHSSSDLVRLSRAGWMPWIKIILRYAGPAVIASITSLVFNLLWQRRRR